MATKRTFFEGKPNSVSTKYQKMGEHFFELANQGQQNEYLKQIKFEDIPEAHRKPYQEEAGASQPYWSEKAKELYPDTWQQLQGAGGLGSGFGYTEQGGWRDVEWNPNIGMPNLEQSKLRDYDALVSPGKNLADAQTINPATGKQYTAADLPAIGSPEHLAGVEEARQRIGEPSDPLRIGGVKTPGTSILGGQSATFSGGNRTTVSIVDFLDSVGQPNDFDSRAGLAAQAGIANYTGTASQNTALLNMLRGKQAPTPSGISGDTLDGAEKIGVPGAGDVGIEDDGTAESAVASATQGAKTFESYYKQFLGEETDAQQQQQELLDQQATGVEQANKLAEEQLRKEQEAKIPEMNQELAGIVGELTQLEKEFQAYKLAQEGKPITLSSISGNIAQKKNMIASEMLLLQGKGLALQGKLNAAQSNVDRAIDLKFKTLENADKLYTAQLNALMPTLNREETARANAMTQVMADKEIARADVKEKEKDINSVLLGYYESGGKDPNVIKGITSANSVTDALMIYGSNIPSEGVAGDYSIVNVNGEDMIFDKNLGTLTSPNQVSQSDTFFTDANGVSWNIEGWATDPTKAQQMQNISDRIGKVDDGNINAKVAEFAPGITADMLRETSSKTGVSWEALLAMVNQESLGGTSNVAQKNNNFAGITWSDNTQWRNAPYNGTKGTTRPSAEGGNYTRFPTKQAGLDAMGALMAQKGTVVPSGTQMDEEVAGYVARVNSGNLTDNQALNEITASKKVALIKALSITPKESDDSSVLEAKDKITEIESLKKSSALNDAVGTTVLSRDFDKGLGKIDISKITGKFQAFIGGVSLITDQLTLDKLIESKERGATFGALSERELQMLANAATKIGSWAVPTGSGDEQKVIGYNIDEKAFKKELDMIKTFYQRDIERKGSADFRTMPDGSVWQINPDGTLTQL